MKTLLIDIVKRVIPWNKSIDVYSNDTDNAYPERMDRLINNSVTAKTSANIFLQNLIGKGFGDVVDGFVVNKEKKLKLIDFADDFANSIARQRGAFIHVNWNANYKISDASLLPFEWCRIGKKDSNDYNGKILVHEDWSATKIKKEDVRCLDVFNPDPKVIDAQVKKAKGWANYKGQILYVNLDSQYYYPLSTIDSVQQDCDSEAQAQIYKNQLLRKGFFGNTLVVTRPLVDSDIPEFITNGSGQQVRNKEFDDAENERRAFQKAITESLGASNAGGVLCLEMDFSGEKLDDAILIKQIDSKIDDKLFAYTESSVRENILVAFNNLPVGLVKASEGLFSNSGEALKEMKRTYWENTTKERGVLVNTLTDLLKKFEGWDENTVIDVIPLLEKEPATPEA